MESVTTICNASQKKLELYDPILQLKEEGKDLRTCISDYVLGGWKERYDGEYISKTEFDKMHDGVRLSHNEIQGGINKLDVTVKNIQSEYILAKTVEKTLKSYAALDMVTEM
jgi:hypothetical protein